MEVVPEQVLEILKLGLRDDTLSELPVVALELPEVVLVALLDGLTGQAVVSSPGSSRGPGRLGCGWQPGCFPRLLTYA